MPATVLVVEDDERSQFLLAYLLQKAGYTVHTASDGREGLEVALRHRPDLILMDVQMPVMGGLELARELRRRDEFDGVPLVAVTAVAMVGDREKILDAGLDTYITKPIAPERFVGQVEALLDAQLVARPGPGPRANTPVVTKAAMRPVTHGPRRRVLIVDDRQDNLVLMRIILEPSGYDVDTVADVRSAVEHAQASPPDLIVSDVHMAGQSGYDLLAAVRADTALSGIPIILISASSAQPPASDRFNAMGVKDFIVRPIDPAELISRLDMALSDREP